MKVSLNDRVALVCASSQGMGFASAKLMATTGTIPNIRRGIED